MQSRFWLRFETGERSGESVPISSAGLSVGRLAENDLVLGAGAVSGRHARLTPAGDDVVLRDLGSTNGTWVGGERIDSRLLRHGDVVRFGSYVAVFLDAESEEGVADELEIRLEEAQPPRAQAPERALPRARAESARTADPLDRTVFAQQATLDPGAAGEGVGHAQATSIARSGRRSILAACLLLVAVAGSVGIWAWRQRGGAARPGRDVAVRLDPANLIGDGFSFELVDLAQSGWENDPDAPSAFARSDRWRVSGLAGAGVELEPGGRARLVSRAIPVSGRDALELRASARVEGDVRLALALELQSSRGSAPALVAPAEERDGEWVLALDPIPGRDRARVVIEARAPGEPAAVEARASEGAEAEPARPVGAVGVDDVELFTRPASGGGPLARFEEYELHGLGPRSAALARIERVLLANLRLVGDDGEPLPLTARAAADGLELTCTGRASALTLLVAAELAQGGVATLGADGNRPWPSAFESDGATDLLLGSGLDRVRLAFGSEQRIVARPVDGGLLVRVARDGGLLVGVARDGGLLERAAGDDGLRALRVQLEFRAERLEAAGLAQEARAAERSGAIGRSLALWDELANRLPYDEELVQEARAQSARFLDAGLARARELEREFERARFFGLADLHRALRSQALELEQSYAPSEVAEAVRATRASIEAELHELEAERRARRDARLAGVLAVLEAEGDLRLAQHVAAELSSAPSAEGAGSGEAAGGGER